MTRSAEIKKWQRERAEYARQVADMTDRQLRAEHDAVSGGRSTKWKVTLAEMKRREDAAKWAKGSVSWRRGKPPASARLIHESHSESGDIASRYWIEGGRVWRESDHWQEVGFISGEAWKLLGRTSGVETGYTSLARLVKTGCEWAIELQESTGA